jgi:arylsulfatase
MNRRITVIRLTGIAILMAAAPSFVKAEESKGKIAGRYEDSKEWWPPEVRPPEGAPNVIIFLLDDVGFAQLGQSFGGLIDTPETREQAKRLGVTGYFRKPVDDQALLGAIQWALEKGTV